MGIEIMGWVPSLCCAIRLDDWLYTTKKNEVLRRIMGQR